jgi:hypothetical protein
MAELSLTSKGYKLVLSDQQVTKGTNALGTIQIPDGAAHFRLILPRQTEADKNGLWLSDDEIEIILERSKDGIIWEPAGGGATLLGGQRKRLTRKGEVEVAQDWVSFGIGADGYIYRPLIISKQIQVLRPRIEVIAPNNLTRPTKSNSVGVVDTDYASSSSASSLTTPSITNTGSNTLATLRVGADVSAGAPSAVKWGGSGGASLAEIGTGVVGTTTYPEVHAYYKIAPSTSGAQTFYAAFSGAGNCYITGGIRDNVDQSTPIHGSLVTDYQYNADITLTVAKAVGEIVEGVAFACDSSEDGMYTSLSGDAVVSNDVDLLYCAGSSGHSNSTGTSKTFVTTGSYTDADVVGLAYAIKEASGGGSTDLVIQDITSASVNDNLALTQAHILAIQDTTSASAIDNLALTQAHSLVIQDTTSASSADNAVLTVTIDLVVADITSASAIDAVVLTQDHQLVIQDQESASTLENIVLTQDHILVIQDAVSGTSLANVTLEAPGTLVIQDAVSGSALETIDLTQDHTLSIQDITSASRLGAVVWVTLRSGRQVGFICNIGTLMNR